MSQRSASPLSLFALSTVLAACGGGGGAGDDTGADGGVGAGGSAGSSAASGGSAGVAGSAGSGGSGSTECVDISGRWSSTEVKDATACGGDLEVVTESLSILQSGCAVTVSTRGVEFQGTVRGDRVSWTGSFPDSGGITTITALALRVEPSSSTGSGTALWTWTGAGTTCTGKTEITATRQPPPRVSSTTPADGEVGVPITTTITVEFDEIAPTLESAEFTLVGAGAAATGELFSGGTFLTFTPAGPLAYATTYTVTLSAGVAFSDGQLLPEDHVWSFTTEPLPENDYWLATATNGAPAGRSDHAAVWTGEHLVIWGGRNESGLLDSGGRYDPVTDTWLALGAGAPSARSGATAVYTEGLASPRLVVWGGTTGAGSTNTGGRYDPARDSWSTTSTTATLDGEPAELPARDGHLAVWTGSRLLVWGGTGLGMTDHRVVWAYDPVADTWEGRTGVGTAPESIQGATGIWTGDELVIWGGLSGTALASGARYSPATSSWSSIATAGAPSARSDHSAVWTGSRMIVWGGMRNGIALADGAAYDASSDAWTPVSSVGADARGYHSAVWTGAEMIVWGGTTSFDAAPGARYDPALDQWTDLPALGQPEGREGASLVWTGTEAIVWGGFFYTNRGGRYRP